MEQAPENGDDLTRLFWQIAVTLGAEKPENTAAVPEPDIPRGLVLPAEVQVEMALDEEYYEQEIVGIDRQSDGRLIVTAVGPDDNAFPFPYAHESLDRDPPQVGETMRIYGLAHEQARGVAIGDRTYFYAARPSSPATTEVNSVINEGNLLDRNEQSQVPEVKLECLWRMEALPWPLKNAVYRASVKDPNGNINAIALQHVENAARILQYCNGNPDKIMAFMKEPAEIRAEREAEIGIVGADSLVGECRIALWCIKHVGWDLEVEM